MKNDWYERRKVREARGKIRTICKPVPWLMAIQRKILREVLDQADPGPWAHAYVKGRNTRSFAAPHVGMAVVVRVDLKDFFGSVTREMVEEVFLDEFLENAAGVFADLCVDPETGAPGVFADLCVDPETGALPQGAPTSPALANLAARELDRRFASLFAISSVTPPPGFVRYTRYADDLAFSVDSSLDGYAFADFVEEFLERVRRPIEAEGFAINEAKTRIMRKGQRQILTGLIVNGTAEGGEPRETREKRRKERAKAHQKGKAK